MDKVYKLAHNFFKDDKGKVVLWQMPNTPLWGWIICTAAGFVLSAGNLKNGASTLGTAFLFTWAYLEISSGATYFRRVLGLTILLYIALATFI